ncbi:inner-membrane translocator [Candidatus Vecturithrix granuli]|uniref:Inner-membrane translocator n=1 Tax=Vecturithrix granuli TaxID=1499967 RepID=A0A0S6WA14_VECG1|nr:inner-membrane translocator [Candidatus Vecturithrix granuli]
MLLQQLLNGLAQGSTYALVAVGFALIFGTLRLVTFAHGEVFMLGAFTAYTMMRVLHTNMFAAFAAAFVISALLGIVIEFVGFRLLRDAPHTSSLLVTIGFSIILLNAAQLLWGAETKSFPLSADFGQIRILGLNMSIMQFVVYFMTIGLIIGLQLMLNYTKLGRTIRATAQDHEAAFVLGVDINKIYSLTFALGSSLGGLAGVLVGIYYNAVYPTMGAMMGLKAFSACILGGLTSIPGAVVAGIFLGEVENLSVAYLASGFRHVFSFAILIVMLLFRPSGLFGKKAS